VLGLILLLIELHNLTANSICCDHGGGVQPALNLRRSLGSM